MLSSQDRRGVTIIAICLLVIASLGVTAAYLKMNQIDLDDETLCPDPSLIPSHIVILVDRTDYMSASQISRTQEEIRKVRDSAEEHSRLTLVLLDAEKPTEVNYLFSLCKPLTGDEANEVYQNPRLIQRRFNRDFNEPFRSATDELLEAGEAVQSPLVQYLRAIGEWSEFQKIEHRVIVFASDLLQHTPPEFSHHDQRQSQYGALHEFGYLPLADVDFRVLYLERPRYQSLQSPAHLASWREYIVKSGGNWLEPSRMR